MSQPNYQPIRAEDVPPRAKASNYPEPFAARMAGRVKRRLGDVFGIAGFGVNLTTLRPGGRSALLHRHSHQEEFVYILSGTPTLRTDAGAFLLHPGMCAGFVPGGPAHQLVNVTDADVVYLEIGDRDPEDRGFYPEDDLEAVWTGGGWRFLHKDGAPY
ncbi:cupin domain-containing protein [Amaricoccus sp.]|uniref:cupin domain-containing protein n=1 Tax=Amaricoccus sp. TaxID=1872485 RepID=UPI00260609EE|nr:cupin domain-containing protein [uncultured Amaricoccus sp.]